MALSTGRVSNIVQIIGKDAASAEIEKAIKSLERMKKQAASSSDTAGTDKAASAFSRLGRRVGDAAAKFAPLALGAGVAYAAMSKIWDSAKEGAKFLSQLDVLEKGVEAFGAKLNSAQKAAAGTISEKSLVQGAAVLKNFGISLGNFDKIAEQVAKTAVATGQSTEFLLNSIATGVARGSPMILDNLGIQVSLSAANEEYAASLGKTVAALTEAEKKTALMNATLKALEKNNIDVNLQDARSASINRTTAAWDDFTTRIEIGAVSVADAGISVGGFIDDTFGFLGSAFPRALELMDPAFDKLDEGIEASAKGFEAFKEQQKDVIYFNRLLAAGFGLAEAGALLLADKAREAAAAEMELAEAGNAAAKSQALMAENMKRAADEAAGFAILLAGDFTGSTKNTKKKKKRGGGGSLSKEAKEARALAKALGISRKEARKLLRTLALSDATESRLKAHADFVEAKRKARAADLADEEAAIDAAVDEALAGLSRIEAAENAADQRKKDRLVAAAEHQRGLIDVAKTGADGQLANALALSDGLQGMWQADADLKKATLENDQQGIDDANKKKQQAEKSALAGGVALARQGAMALGASKKEMAFLDGLIEAARSYASFAIGDFGGGAAHAAASAAFFVASASGGGGGGGGGSKGGGGGPKRSKAISSASGSQQGGGTTIVNFQGFAIGSAAQLGSELSGALGAVRGTGQDRAAAV